MVTEDPVRTAHEFGLALRILAGLAFLLGVGLWNLALVYRRRGLHRHGLVLLAGGTLALAASEYMLWALP
jgi:hypothetical protein